MVIFNELRLSGDKQYLIADCQIEDLNVYEGLYIESIYLEYYKNMQQSGTPSDKAYLIYDDEQELEHESAVKRYVSVSELPEDFGTDKFDGGLFYVIVRCEGESSTLAQLSTLPCGSDNMIDIGVVVDWKPVYDVGMQYVLGLSSSCVADCADMSGFESFCVLWNAIKLAIASCDYDLLERLWDKFMRITRKMTLAPVAGCGCNK